MHDAASEPVAGTLSLAASVERVRELRAAATDGPWVLTDDDRLGLECVHDHEFTALPAADAAFIAAVGSVSWDDLVAALTELDRLRAALRETLAWAPSLTSPGYRAAAKRARAALSPTPMPPIPPTPSVPTKEGTPDAE